MATSAEILKERIARGFLVERVEDMTPEYLQALKGTLYVTADTELMSVAAQRKALQDAPSLNARISMLAVMQDELGHAHIAYRLLAELGEDPEWLLYERPPEQFKNAYLFDIAMDSFAEVAVFHALVDRAGYVLLGDVYQHTSYGPWKRALVKVDKEENFHLRHGETWMRKLARDPQQRERLQQAIDWMFLLALEFFGMPDSHKSRPTQLEYRLKGHSNDELRQIYLGSAVPFLEELSLACPARRNPETGRYELTVPYPCAFDPVQRRWRFDQPCGPEDVLRRWKGKGADYRENVNWLRSGYLELQRLTEAI